MFLPPSGGWQHATDLGGERLSRLASGVTQCTTGIRRRWHWPGSETEDGFAHDEYLIHHFSFPIELQLLRHAHLEPAEMGTREGSTCLLVLIACCCV